MILTYLSLFVIVPAAAILLIGGYFARKVQQANQTRTWVLVLLGAAILLLVPIVLAAEQITTSMLGLVLFGLIPALEGLLALILLQWRVIYAQWQQDRAVVSVLLGVLLLLIVSTAHGELYYPIALLIPALILALAWTFLSRFKLGLVFGLSGLTFLFQMLVACGVIGGRPVFDLDALRVAYMLMMAAWAMLALMLPALLIYRGWMIKESQGKSQAYISFILAGLLVLGGAAIVFRNGVMINATARGVEDHLPFGEILVSVLAGMVLIVLLKGKGKIIGWVYLIAVPVIIVVAYSAGWLVQPQAITQARADRIRQAVEAYHQQTGAYPSELGELTPDYMTFILGPLTGRSQVWCYQGHQSYYRLGYVFIQRYYQPTLFEPYYAIKIHSSAGEIPAGSWMCDQELEQAHLTGGL
jgi:hypothetical protein